MSQPAYAGIAGLSVREFKPTGLQAGWLFSDGDLTIMMRKFHTEFTAKNLTGNAGLLLLGKFAEKLRLQKMLGKHISIKRAAQATYNVQNTIMMLMFGALVGAKHISHMAILRYDETDGVIRLSIDTKASINIGPFARGGYNRCMTQAADHDFAPDSVLKLFGIYLPAFDENYMYFSESNVTADFMVDSLCQYLVGCIFQLFNNISYFSGLKASSSRFD